MNPAKLDDDLKRFLKLEGLRTLTRPVPYKEEELHDNLPPEQESPLPESPSAESKMQPMPAQGPNFYGVEDVRANPTLEQLRAPQNPMPQGPMPPVGEGLLNSAVPQADVDRLYNEYTQPKSLALQGQKQTFPPKSVWEKLSSFLGPEEMTMEEKNRLDDENKVRGFLDPIPEEEALKQDQRNQQEASFPAQALSYLKSLAVPSTVTYESGYPKITTLEEIEKRKAKEEADQLARKQASNVNVEQFQFTGDPEKDKALIDKMGLENPDSQIAANDLIDKAQNNKAVKSEFSEAIQADPSQGAELSIYPGRPLPKEVVDSVGAIEKWIEGDEDEIDKMDNFLKSKIQEIETRINDNQETDYDKYLIGLALAAPLIAAGLFGKEVGLGAFAGAAQGIADIMQGREEKREARESSIFDLMEARVDLLKTKSQLRSTNQKRINEVTKNIPKDVMDAYKGKVLYSDIDPLTKQPIAGFQLGKNIYLDVNHAMDNPEQALKNAADFTNYLTDSENMMELLDVIYDVQSQMKDVPNWAKIFQAARDDKYSSDLIANLSDQQVMHKGRKQSAYQLLDGAMSKLQSFYKKSSGITGNLTDNLVNHVNRLTSMPWNTFKSNDSLLDQTEFLATNLVKEVENFANQRSFLLWPIQQQYLPYLYKMKEIRRILTEPAQSRELIK